MSQNHEIAAFFRDGLLDWFRRHKRDLPWRSESDPYRIWVSEIMLQQTRVDTVIPYYERFIRQYPTLDALADAPEEEVLKAWEGLGYYSRARNLLAGVREVKELYGGVVPDSREEISSLKGIGPYTAGAILSIAYNKPEPAVDGNVMRVLARFFLIEDDIAKPRTRIAMEDLVRGMMPAGSAGDFNQALMELGALVCTPKAPHCLTCPVMEKCQGRIAGRELKLPVKKKAKPSRIEYRAAALIEGTGENRGRILVRRRPDSGLLAGMWELPHVEVGADEWADEALWSARLAEGLRGHGIALEAVERLRDETHVFSHIRWEMRVMRCRGEIGFAAGGAGEGDDDSAGPDKRPAGFGEAGADAVAGWIEYRWLSPREFGQFAFPKVFLRILGGYRQSAVSPGFPEG